MPTFVVRLLLPYLTPVSPGDHRRDTEKPAEFIRWYEAAFTETKNPLYAWCAYRHARAAGLDVPEWVSAYLDSAAEKLWATRPSGRWRKDAARVAEALGITERFLAEFHGSGSTDIELAAYVYSWSRGHKKRPGHGKPYLEWPKVAERFGVSPATVTRAWNKYKHLFPPQDP